MSYESPIEIICGEMKNQLENDVYSLVQSYGVKVDKDELMKALEYDRNQYQQGYSDAKAETERKKGKWQRRKDEDCWECSECHAVLENSDIGNHNFYYCYHCGADMMDICGYMNLEKANYE